MLYGIISDIHSNKQALDAVLVQLKDVDKIICLGDIIGYGPEPNECVEIIRGLNGIVIVGNHDLASLGEKDIELFNPHAKEAILWTTTRLNEENKRYLRDLPYKANFENAVVVHGSLRDFTDEYILSVYDALGSFELLEHEILFIGHTHAPYYFQKGDRVYGERLRNGDIIKIDGIKRIINVGSVGQPRDVDNRASFAIFDTEKKEIEIKRVPYDISKTQRLMREYKLPDFLIFRLEIGI
ncbi:MAG: metallophosphoesterase family protein [bacterium]|nr:metallophosphoesterase family protein [bacterium]